ncbi:hypothetical protein FACS18949_06860 [Clostridia bacterium]|nr:hypothetical protein FACS18949_06860 [Clostridia bacterium]
MRNIVNFLRGYAVVTVVCDFPERFLNFCAQNGVAVWGVTREDAVTLRAFVTRRDLKRALTFAGASTVGKRGLPAILWRFRARYALIAGFLATVIGLLALSQFVWEIGVTGNEKVPSDVILRELDELGIGIGTPVNEINSAHIQNLMILNVPELEWLAVNVRGSVATVEVRERAPKPQIVAQNEPCNVVAAKSGLIVSMNTLMGAPQTAVGQAVEAGDLLVSGLVNSEIVGMREVHAIAEVKLRTWYEYTAVLPQNFTGKTYTGRVKTRRAIIIGDKRVNFYKNSSQTYASCDKLERRITLRIPPSLTLPVTFVTETYTEYAPSSYQIAEDAADGYLRGVLGIRLHEGVADGEITSAGFTTERGGGVWVGRVVSECLEDAALTVPIDK